MRNRILPALTATLLLYGPFPALADDTFNPDLVARGRYLVLITSCNECHTASYADSMGQLPETQWLMGDALGEPAPAYLPPGQVAATPVVQFPAPPAD